MTIDIEGSNVEGKPSPSPESDELAKAALSLLLKLVRQGGQAVRPADLLDLALLSLVGDAIQLAAQAPAAVFGSEMAALKGHIAKRIQSQDKIARQAFSQGIHMDLCDAIDLSERIDANMHDQKDLA